MKQIHFSVFCFPVILMFSILLTACPPPTTTATPAWAQQSYIKAINADSSDRLAGVSLSGDTIAVASPYEASNQTTITNGVTASSDNSNATSGAVYVYRRSGANWAQEAYIKADNNGAGDMFCTKVSLSGDTLAVSAYQEDSNQNTITTSGSSDDSISNSGAVYIFKRLGTLWSQEAYIKADNNIDVNDADDWFGFSISLEGDTLAVGAYQEDSNQTTITVGGSSDNSSSNSGSVHVYTRSGSTWTQQAYLKASNNNTDDSFGCGVAVSGDTLAVGAYQEDSNQTTITNGTTASSDNSSPNSGAVYVYKRSGSAWTQEAYIKASNCGSGDLFGWGLAISGDTLAVSAYCEDSNQTSITNGTTASSDNSNSESGAVYVYKRTGSIWAQEAYIKAINNGSQDSFGFPIALSGDILAVAAPFEDSSQASITNGTTASSDNSNSNSGAVFVFKRTGTTWTQQAYIKAVNNSGDDRFGLGLDVETNTLVVGAPYEDSDQRTITNSATVSTNENRSDSGAMYIYYFQ